jgi:Nucleoside-diphosphate-sugar pyrophosphorylase involved in lipopolysaccharide biosynthesis/translation initiation factor 2B, gamma/epsilon subunits (eIF-2Bgamma/eIF-2Bepsilon)
MPQGGVLAGGRGTRLGSLSERVPKSLVEVAGQPILSHILDGVAAQGCTRALVLKGHLGEQFEEYDHEGGEIVFHKEKSPLGTGGALWGARDLIEERSVLLWGDDKHMIDYSPLLQTHNSAGGARTMTVTTSYTSSNLEHMGGRVIRYDKRLDSPEGLNGYEAGTSIGEKSVQESPGRDGAWSWEEGVYPAMSGLIAAHLDETPFWDMGTPERLRMLESFLKEGRA